MAIGFKFVGHFEIPPPQILAIPCEFFQVGEGFPFPRGGLKDSRGLPSPPA